ncbi:MAG: DUF937 domain-containing protein [Gammaproteobacteria bacterium]|nr:DUF937 domain-containing protein [Gammaproteobacteria bacterium]
MGLFDEVLGAATGLGGRSGQSDNALADAVMQMIGGQGGIGGLLQTLQKAGLGDVAGSWVSNGANLPVSAEQLMGALGGDQIGQLARQLGVGNDQASGTLAEYLPKVIDMLTPDGNVPEGGGDLMSQGLAMLKGSLFR